MNFIYLDNNSTSAPDAAVIEAMLPYLTEKYGNPSSGHVAGKLAKEGLDRAREQVAQLINCNPKEVVFTGGASEANNLCIKGTAWAAKRIQPNRRLQFVSSCVDHASVRLSCRFFEEQHGDIFQMIGVDALGTISLNDLNQHLQSDTFLVSLMLAQNEVGTLQPAAEFAKAIRQKSSTALFHVDASQAAGKIPVDVKKIDADMLVLAAHKFYGPKGVGAAFVREGIPLVSLVSGVSHEGGRRAGTENIAGIVGLGKACELARKNLEKHSQHTTELRDWFWQKLQEAVPGIQLNGHPTLRLPGTLNISLPNADSNAVLAKLSSVVGASNGAACHWGVNEPSTVLTAMGISRERALAAIRFSLGQSTTREELERAVAALKDCLR